MASPAACDLCSPQSRSVRAEAEAAARRRLSGAVLAAVVLAACCAVLLSAQRGPAFSSLDEAAALRLAEEGEGEAAGENRLPRNAALKQSLAVRGARSALAMAQAYFGGVPAASAQQLAQLPGASAEPVWPGLRDFRKHEAKLRAAERDWKSMMARKIAAGAPHPHPQALEWDPNCPCRGGCPCPAHGHGDNVVAPAQEEGAASGEFKQGLEEGIALGVKIGLKEGLTEATDLKGELIRKEAAHIMAAGGASVERRFVEKVQGKYEKAEHALREVQAWETGPGDSEGAVPKRALARKAGAQGQRKAPTAPVKQPQVLSGKAEDKYIKNVEKRFLAEEKTLKPSVAAQNEVKRAAIAHQPVSAAADTAKIKRDLKMLDEIAGGKISQPSSNSNLPWPFKRTFETPYPEPKDGEYRGHPAGTPSMPGTAGGSGAVAGAGQQHLLPMGMTAIDHQHMLDAIAKKRASHDQDVDAITDDSPFGSLKKAEAHSHLSSKAAALAHSADVEAIAKPSADALARATADFEMRGKRLKSLLESGKGQLHYKDPWLAKRILAVHDESVHIPRTLHQKAVDEDWQKKSDEVARQMQAAKGALASVAIADQSSEDVHSQLAGAAKVSKEFSKTAKIEQEIQNLIETHNLAAGHKASETELADFTVGAQESRASAQNAVGFTEADAHALGFTGLAGLEEHLARRLGSTDAPEPKIPLCTEDHPENCRGARAAEGGNVGVQVRVLGGGSSRDALGFKTRADAEDASMRTAIRQAAIEKARAVGKPAAVALGYTGVHQLAAHLEREALDHA